jgi:hypothetical protein
MGSKNCGIEFSPLLIFNCKSCAPPVLPLKKWYTDQHFVMLQWPLAVIESHEDKV